VTGLPIRYEGHVMGVVVPEGEDLSFTYHPRWLTTPGAFPLSLRMPLGTAVFGGETLRPWLANLLPEDANLRGVGRTLGIAPQDVLGLLERIGRDTAGALSFGDAAHLEETPGYRLVGGPSDLERIIEELPAKPFLAGEEGVSMSLAGAQEKVPVAVLADGSLAIPVHGAASTHILKPDARQRLWGSVQNEALCLTLASLCGLPAAGATTGRAGERHYLLVSRYDRVQRNGRWVRLHQEGFCQALGKPPSVKYASNGIGVRGPGLPDLFILADEFLTASDRTHLLDAVVFNVLTCNTDAHAKNYAILLTGRGPSLAPLYDVLCAEA
jgi:serine/threonine-protein kinase HipA